jgi:hypothetical protein
MTVDINSPIYGLKEAVKQLNSIEPGLKTQITRDYRRVAKPVIEDAKSMIPQQVPLSGMARNWSTNSGYKMFPWVVGHSQKISAKINTRKITEFAGMKRNVGTFTIRYGGGLPVLFDMAENGSLGAQLRAKYGQRSRVMWPAYEKNRMNVEIEMGKIVETVMDKVNRNVVQ